MIDEAKINQRRRSFAEARVIAVSTPESRKAWVKAATDEDLRAMVVDGQVELMCRAMKTATLAFDHTAESIRASLDEVATMMEPRAGMSIHAQRDIHFAHDGQVATRHNHPILPYLLEGVHIKSCPVIGKEQLKGDPLDFDGMEI